MPKNKVRTHKVRIRIRDVGDEPRTLFLIGIAQRPVEPGNARLINWSTLHWIVDTAGRDKKKLIGQVCWTLEHDGECIIENFGVSSQTFSNLFVGDILQDLVHSTKKANQSDGLKRAFRERKLRMMQQVPPSPQQGDTGSNAPI